jgi:hypothetical protein
MGRRKMVLWEEEVTRAGYLMGDNTVYKAHAMQTNFLSSLED